MTQPKHMGDTALDAIEARRAGRRRPGRSGPRRRKTPQPTAACTALLDVYPTTLSQKHAALWRALRWLRLHVVCTCSPQLTAAAARHMEPCPIGVAQRLADGFVFTDGCPACGHQRHLGPCLAHYDGAQCQCQGDDTQRRLRLTDDERKELETL